MDAILKYFTENPQFVPIATAAIALIGVFLSAFVSAFVANVVSKRSAYITAVTAERSKWIDKLRSNIAELLGVCGAIHLSSSDKTSDKALEKRQNADRLIALITLQLNPNDKSGIDQNLIKLLPELVKSSEKDDNSYRVFEQRFVRHAQFLLKEEWEKVKTEAKGTFWAWLTGSGCRRRKRLSDYREFSSAEK
jgi:hypothetical protein